ncbi:Spc97 / Spc98 family protein [Trichomonas vaginalis G3]|uniref:Spc97 / Spc98 family protein n=1 Tax=Trichomonas vaginalis (strain ATCC PRA-98 / G3) TaxID=412133 RepID=A2EPP8_TRIV3|nr:microtubule nucleation by interphase microtubule organizing center [Trichomonas vaginalis G3]EAY05391.1 Spc97 / Spc98 family protein [Trichomonas vaginalis G3]KAI5524080.1 microtubule nucleation by interphase microtubule organizing center [Trichomonas vaginalis G3]|eukprot:XP_001317614.1 Spc97 / Spc98 family protein [Trichomonas vaginalis G3]
MNDNFAASQQIGKLVNHFSPNNEKLLADSIDIMRNYTNIPTIFQKTAYQTKWIKKLNETGKIQDITKLQRAISKISKSSKHPEILFAFFDNIITEKADGVPKLIYSELEPTYKTETNEIPRDFLFVLQGFDSDTFKWNHKADKFIYTLQVPQNFVYITKKVSEIGCILRFLRTFEQKMSSLIFQNAYNYVKELITMHCSNVVSLNSKIEKLSTIEFLKFLKNPLIDKLRAAAIICNTTFGLKGGYYYNKLHSLCNHGDLEIKTVAQEMTNLSFKMIEEMVREWISRGEIIDQYEEFFIKKNPDVHVCSEWWERQYSLITAEAPLCFNSTQVQQIFDTGKILNFLRRWYHLVDLNVDESLKLNEYIDKCSEKAEKIIIDIMHEKKLNQNLHHIYSYLLLGRGDFANSFMAIDDDAKHIQLNRIAYEVARQPIEGFDFIIRDQSWAFSYYVNPPLSLLLNSKVMSVYKSVSSRLLHLKRTEYKLLRCREEFKNEKEYCTTVFQMIHFINFISDFFHQEVIQKSFDKLEKSLSKAKKISEMMGYIEKHCAEIARGCWVSNSGKNCSTALNKVLVSIEAVTDTDKTLEQCVSEFSNAIIDFKAQALQSKTGASELVRPLSRIFSNFLIE